MEDKNHADVAFEAVFEETLNKSCNVGRRAVIPSSARFNPTGVWGVERSEEAGS